jgi:hypothetical protein
MTSTSIVMISCNMHTNWWWPTYYHASKIQTWNASQNKINQKYIQVQCTPYQRMNSSMLALVQRRIWENPCCSSSLLFFLSLSLLKETHVTSNNRTSYQFLLAKKEIDKLTQMRHAWHSTVLLDVFIVKLHVLPVAGRMSSMTNQWL